MQVIKIVAFLLYGSILKWLAEVVPLKNLGRGLIFFCVLLWFSVFKLGRISVSGSKNYF